jgi:hypothetical protein
VALPFTLKSILRQKKEKENVHHPYKHNRPQTIYQINQRLSTALQCDVGEQLIACECAG